MAVTVVQTALGLGNGAGNASSSADPINTTTGNLLVVFENDEGGKSPTFTDNAVGNTWTAFLSQTNPTTPTQIRGWYAKNIVGRSGHVFSMTLVGGFNSFVVVELAGADLTAPLDTSSLGSIADTATPYTVTSGTFAGAAEYALAMIGGGGSSGTGTYSESTGFTKLREEGDSNWYTMAVAGKQLSATTAVTPSFTESGIGFTNAALAVVGIVPASTGSVALTGVSATGSVGSLSRVVAKALTGISATGSPGTVGKTLAKGLTGNSGTGSVGTVAKSVVVAITGNTATGTAGTVTANTGGGPISVALTGVSSTGSVGTVSPSVTVGLSGVTGTGSVGTVTVVNGGTSIALTGTTGTGSAGTVSPSVAKALTGVSGTGSPGSVTASLAQALTGTVGTGSAGSLGPDVTVALSGVAATGSVGTVTAQSGANVALTGVTGTGSVGQPGVAVTVGLSGVSATGSVGSVSVPGSGGIDVFGAKAIGPKKKKKPLDIPVAGPTMRDFIEGAMSPKETKKTETYDEDEEEILMLLL